MSGLPRWPHRVSAHTNDERSAEQSPASRPPVLHAALRVIRERRPHAMSGSSLVVRALQGGVHSQGLGCLLCSLLQLRHRATVLPPQAYEAFAWPAWRHEKELGVGNRHLSGSVGGGLTGLKRWSDAHHHVRVDAGQDTVAICWGRGGGGWGDDQS